MGNLQNFDWKKLVTWICRILAGCVFIFSGIAKGIDPWGSFYMMEDYLSVWDINIPPQLVITGAFLLIITEFLVGIFTITGCFRRGTPVIMTCIMAFMLPLTLWIAIKNPVSDCGCFGEAYIISNSATFWKNVVLTAMSVWLLIYNRNSTCLIMPYLQWIFLLGTVFFILIISFLGFFYQPLIDFRPYKISTALIDDSEKDTIVEPEFEFIYEKDGKRKSFLINDELPDESDGWKFITRKEINNISKSIPSKKTIQETPVVKSFRIWDEEGENDITDDLVYDEGKQLFLMMPELGRVSVATSYKINSLYQWCENQGIDMLAVVSGSSDEIEEWKDLSLPEYPIFIADDTAIKEVVRGNPAVVYVENGKIVWKKSLKALPTDDFLSEGTSKDPHSFVSDDISLFKNICFFYLIFTALMISPKFLYFRKKVRSQN